MRGEHGHDRRADRLGGSGGGEDFREAGRDPTTLEGGTPTRRDGEEGGGGEDGEQEAVGAGQQGS
jgi:hypothetical protein